jgi:hypothetical protein
MTVVREDSYVEYTADGQQTVFTFDFPFIEVEDINVFINGVLVAETEYSIVADPETGGYVQFTVAPAENSLVLIARNTPATQETDYPPYGPFPAEAHERALDKLTMLIQESLAATDIIVGLSFKYAGTWQPNFGYTQMNIVAYGSDPERFDFYICGTNHQSGDTFDSSFWNLLIDLQDFWDAVEQVESDKEIVAGYVQQTFEYMVRAENAAGQAELYRDQAQTSEGNAAASAQNATNCAAAASGYSDEAEGHATQAQLYEWEAEAEKLTADSYANQDEDVPVDIYTSNGDGTFTATPTNPPEYSSYHWSKKAADTITGVATVTGSPPIIVDNTDAANPIVTLDSAKIAVWDGVVDKADFIAAATGSVDPNTFYESYLVTDHANGPESGTMFHIYQKGVSANGAPLEIGDERFQRAVEYRPGVGVDPRTFVRSYQSDDGWSAWKEEGSGGGGGGGGLTWVAPKTADFTAVSGEGYPIDTETAMTAITFLLPASPTENMQVGVKDFANSFHQYEVYADPQGEEIDNQGTEPMLLNVRGWAGTFVYSGGQWMVVHSTPMNGEVLNKPFMHVQHQEPSGTDGGASTAGDNIRTLNTVLTNEISGASLGSNLVTLPAGEYYAEAVSTFQVGGSASKLARNVLRDETADVDLVQGENVGATNVAGSTVSQLCPVAGKFTLTTTSTISVTTVTDYSDADGFGRANSFSGRNEVYTDLRIWKLDTDLKKITVQDPQQYLKKPFVKVTAAIQNVESIAGTVVDRDVHNIISDEIGVSIVNGEVVLPAGEYEIDARGQVYGSGRCYSWVRKSDGTNLIDGIGLYTRDGTYAGGAMTLVHGRILLTEQTAIKFSSETTVSSNLGFGNSGHKIPPLEICIWQLDAVVQAPKIFQPVNQPISGAYVTGNIYGGELEYIDATNVRVKPVSCMSDDLAQALYIDANTDVAMTLAADTIYNFFVVRYDTAAFGIEYDTDVNGANLPANVTHKRWLGYVYADSSGNIDKFVHYDDQMTFVDGIIVAVTSSTSVKQYDASAYLPLERVKMAWISITPSSASGGLTLYHDELGVQGAIVSGDWLSSGNNGGVAGLVTVPFFWARSPTATNCTMSTVQLRR